MSTVEQDAEHLIVAADIFAGERFWAALDRLAQRRGHGDHPRLLRGRAEPTNWYELHCLGCDRAIATMTVQREAD